MNCEKSARPCVYVLKSPKQTPVPEASTSTSMPVVFYDQQPFPFRPPAGMTAPTLPTRGQPAFNFEDMFPATSHVFENPDLFSTSSPQDRNVTGGIVRNAVLVNNIQSRTQLQNAIHSFSRDCILRGQALTVESLLSPMIYRSAPWKHAILANAFLQAEQNAPSDPTLHLRHYTTAVHLLHTTHDTVENVIGTSL